MAGDAQAKIELVVIEDMRIVVIRHEFADELAVGDQRDEGQCSDSLVPDDGRQRVGHVRRSNIGYKEGLWTGILTGPGRVAVDCLAVAVRQAAPVDEPHDTRVITKQDRSPVAVQRVCNCIQRGVVDRLQGFRAM